MARRHHCHGKDTITNTFIGQHRRTTAAASEVDGSHFNTAFAAAVDIAAATAVTVAVTITFTAAIAAVLALSAAITAVIIAAVAAATAAAAATCPHPCLCCHYCCSLCQHHCTSNAPVDGWLLCHLLLLICCIVHGPNLSAPPVMQLSTLTMTAIATVNNCHCHCHSQQQRPSKASGSCLSSTAAMTIIGDCSGGRWQQRQCGRPPVAATAAAAANAATIMPLHLPPPSPSLQPLPMA